MKHLSKFFLAFVLVLGYSVTHAQDKNNPWALSFGINAVDHYPVGASAPQGSLFSDFGEVDDHWNILPGFSRIAISRYIGSGFSAKIDGSINSIKKFGDEEVNGNRNFLSANAGVTYSLRHMVKGGPKGWLDPYLGVGVGSTWIESDAQFMGVGELGINFWFSDRVALEVGTSYHGSLNHNFTDYSHFQHFIGFKIAVGGKDSDGDGVYDKFDECPDVPGLPEFNGCPDTDGDGVPDHLDECPEKPGLPEFNGCPDTDGDGIPDHLDDCPLEPGPAEFNGCPDTDGDGIPDHLDDCPEVPGPKENNGCPEEEVTEEKMVELNSYSETIQFDLNKATIRPESYDNLKAIAREMKKYANTKFHLAGFTDITGTVEYNNQLSKKRAEAVKNHLVEKEGVDAGQLTSEGYGPKNPVASNQTREGREKNRRVSIILAKDRQDLENQMK